MGLHRRSPWRSPHASRSPSTALRGPIGDPPRAPVAQSDCASLAQYSASWPHREIHRRSPRRSPHPSPPP
eukprot:2445999-Pyramimonas_sp.AAC.1